MKIIKTELKKTEIAQLYFYLENTERDGVYYGFKKHYNQRHKRLKEFINSLEPKK